MAAAALPRLSGPPGGTPALSVGVGIRARKLINMASQPDKPKRDARSRCMDGIWEEVLRGGGWSTPRLGFQEVNQERRGFFQKSYGLWYAGQSQPVFPPCF